MKNIVITGAGPIGLYLAIRLNQIIKTYRLDTTVTVIDPRVGKYDRPGIVARMALMALEKGIGFPLDSVKEGDDTGTAMFIQDLEKSLYEIATSMKVKFINSQFKEFVPHYLKITNSLNKEQNIPCDMALDCSGPKRALVKSVSAKSFETLPVGDNPLKCHFIAYVNMDEKNAKLMHEKLPPDKNLIKHAIALEKLRALGWSEFVEPELSSRTYATKTKDSKETTRFYLYFEIPPALINAGQEKQLEWLNALLYLKTENENIQFEIESGKMKFIPFLVDPHKVEPHMAEDKKNSITVVPCGDAQIEPDYRLGIGILSGIQRADALLESIELRNNEIQINQEKYKEFLKKPMGLHQSELEKDYIIRKKGFIYGLEKEKLLYEKALLLFPSLKEKSIILDGLKEINKRLAMHHLEKGQAEFKKTTDRDGKIKLNKNKELENPALLDDYKDKLIQALQLLPNSATTEIKQVKEDLFQLALTYKELAGELFKYNRLVPAKKYYETSLKLLTKHFAIAHTEEIAKIYSNLCVILMKQKRYDDLIQTANSAFDHIDEGQIEEKLVVKIKYNKCRALLEKIALSLTKSTTPQAQMQKEAEDLYKSIESRLDPTSQRLLKEKFDSNSMQTKLPPGFDGFRTK